MSLKGGLKGWKRLRWLLKILSGLLLPQVRSWPDFSCRKKLARELDVTTKTLDRWAREGKGPARTRLGRKILYSRTSVIA
jgi:hypothetical protein